MRTAMATRQSPTASRPTTAIHMICLFFFITAAVLTNGMPALANRPPPPSTLVFYAQEDLVPPDVNRVEVASPSGNLAAEEFGTISVVADVLRETAAPDSPVLGVDGGTLVTEKDLATHSVALTYVLNTTSFAGTISVQGVTREGVGELAITGGTYDFRFAKGYADINRISDSPQERVIKVVLYIKYD